MKAFYTDSFVLPLPDEHRFPMSKYSRLRRRVVDEGVVAAADLEIPAAATDVQLARVHTADYLGRVGRGDLGRDEVRRIGFPWSPELVERSRRSVGGTVAACRAALADGVAVNLAGGTHHAFADHGEGYCVFNDVAVALRVLQAEGRFERAVVVDLDVHQGNGTAAIFAGDPSVFTLSIHGERNYPFHKQAGDLDVGLPDGTRDEAYLESLAGALEQAWKRGDGVELVIYVAGADPFEDDRLGRLAVSKAGLAARDDLVFGACRRRGVPVVVVMAGGYARRVEDTVDIHFETVRGAARL